MKQRIEGEMKKGRQGKTQKKKREEGEREVLYLKQITNSETL